MANSRQATKRARQGERRRQHNAALRSRMRTFLKKIVKAIESGDRKAAEGAYKDAVPFLDSSDLEAMRARGLLVGCLLIHGLATYLSQQAHIGRDTFLHSLTQGMVDLLLQKQSA